MPGRRLGRYEIVHAIGAGGMGEVYRARDEHLERDVAVKVLPSGAVGDEGARARFRHEALALSRLNHPNIATIHDFCTEEGVDFLVMEYVEGTTLGAKIAGNALQEREVAQLGAQIAEGLATAHEQTIVHRDIKPENVRITPDGRVKLLDFGLAQLVRHPDAVTVETVGQFQSMAGTLPYMAPEQLRGERVDARTDIHAVGELLYEMSTGRRPYPEPLVAKLIDSILREQPSPPTSLNPSISSELERITLKCLEKDPESRYQSAKDLAIDLRRLASGTTATTTVAYVPRRRATRLPAVAAIGAAVVLVGLAVMNLDWLRRLPIGSGTAASASIVILPSQIFAGEGDRFLADAIPSLLSTQLSQVKGIEVKAPPTSADFQRVGSDMAKIVDAYRVDRLVVSSVNAQADRLILNVQLVEAGSRRMIWSHEYVRERQEYLDLVSVAADGLRQALRPDAPAPSASPVVSNPDTELLLQRGRYYARFYTYRKQPADFDMAIAAFERVLAQDASAAAAASAIAALHVSKIEAGAPLPPTLAEVDRWAARALEIDARSGEAWRLLSIVEEFRPQSDRRKRIEYALKAAWLAPASGQAQHALGTALARNSFLLALAALREASRLDPLQLNSSLAASGGLALMGRAREAVPMVDDVLQIEPDMLVGQLVKSFVLLADRRVADASALLDRLDPHVKAGRLHPAWFQFAQNWRAFEAGATAKPSGDREAPLKWLIAAARGEGPRFPQWESLTLHVVAMLARHGQDAAALETLKARFDAGIVEPYDVLVQNPDLERIRRDPQFQNSAARARVKFEELAVILQEARERKELPSYLDKPLLELLRLRERGTTAG